MKSILMLEDGKSFMGKAMAGASGERIGQVIFNTAVVGYQEMLTDPANAGKILIFTYPLIGNYGTAPKFNESKKVWVEAAVIKEKSRIYSNWQATKSFDDFVKENNLLVLSGIDTRSLAVHLRQKGEMAGIISTHCFDTKELLKKLAESRKESAASFLPAISVRKITVMGEAKAKQKRVAVLDLGITQSILRQLLALGVQVTLLPYTSAAKDIMRVKPHGLIISGGPEQDPELPGVVEAVKGVIGKFPILGIGSGHQVLCQALGAKVVKMRLGHHGVNYPVHNPAAYKGEITVQNHSYVVETESLNRIKDIKITAYNLNDRSVEEIESKKQKLLGIQYVPACPGFDEINHVFLRFSKMVERRN